MSAGTDVRLAAFADLLRGADESLREGLISRAKLLALQGADVNAMPELLTREDWTAETASRLVKISALIDQAGWHDLAARLLDTDDNAQAARKALESRIQTELVVGQDQASRLLTSALGVSARNVGRTAAELLAEAPETVDWVVPNLIGRGWMVKFAGREKGGKGTLIFYLLSRLERGEKTVFGAATDPVSALIVTEEPQDSVREKIDKFGLSEARIIYGYELAGMDWQERCAYLAALATDKGHGIVFQDNISRAAGVEDEAGTELARAAEILSDECKAAGLTIILDHHHKKGGAAIEDKSRGGTALAGATDNNIEIVTSGGLLSRYRKITSNGRISSTRFEETIVLNDAGTDYKVTADKDEPQDAEGRNRLRELRDLGEAGATVAEFQALIGVGEDRARDLLKQYVTDQMATTDGKRPARYFYRPPGKDDLDF